MPKRNLFRFLTASMLIFSFWSVAMAADTYPSRPIQAVTSSSPGGFVDTTLRFMTPIFSKAIGVSVIVSNRPGAGGATGTNYLINAKPDGYTFGCISTKDTIVTPAIIPNIPYKIKDLDPLAKYCKDTSIVFVKGDAPWKTLEELVADAKKRPGEITYGSTTRSVSNFLMESFLMQAGISLLHVPMKNAGEVTIRVLGGNIDVGLSSVTPISGQLRAGNLRALFITSATRTDLFPDIPTLKEKGYKENVLTLYTGFFAPRGLPGPVRNKLVTALDKTLRDPSLKEKVASRGAILDYKSGKELTKEIEQDTKMVLRTLKAMKARKR